MKTVKELQEKINSLMAEIYAIEKKIKNENEEVLVKEILNLHHGIGKGFVEGDHYAPSRYYSSIPGVKNIRFSTRYDENDEPFTILVVKVTSKRGYLLPDIIIVPEIGEMPIVVYKSTNFVEELDY